MTGLPHHRSGDVDHGAPAAASGDQAARERIRQALDETLFVEAGAGAGKTRALVERVLALVLSGSERLGSVAAITFTEKAAAELRDRVRTSLEEAVASARVVGDTDTAARAGEALDELDGAAVGTLHSFAQRILSEHPVEAGLPPRIEVLDEVASMLAFDDRWTGFVDELLEDRTLARPILLLSSVGVRLSVLREIAVSFNENWDLVADRCRFRPEASTYDETPIEGVESVSTTAPAEVQEIPDWEPRLDRLVDEAEDVASQREHCHEDDDPLCQLLDSLADWARQVRTAPDESARLALCMTEGGRPRANPNGKGAKPRWAADYDLPGLRARVADLLKQCEQLANEVAHAALVRVAVELRRFTLASAEERRREGRLEFHDLLVMARQLLRDPGNGPIVRAALADRYRRLLIDEFQDTDPIQVELAVLVASTDPDAGQKPWHAVEPEPGRLFFVGDPKQSIYRFRRADIALFLATADRFGAGDRRLALTTNHRSGRSLVDWFNETFARLITPNGNLDTNGSPRITPAQVSGTGPRSQPEFVPSVAVRPDPPLGVVVSVVGREAHSDRPSADDLRAREAADVAAAVARIVEEGWRVDRSPDWRQPDWQPARAGDVTILIPTRLSLPFLEEALTEAGVAYRAESASLVYGSRLVRDLFLTLRAIDDPSDELCAVAALRSALFGCGDDDLFTFRELHQGNFDHGSPLPDTVPPEHPVAQGLAYLHRMHERRRWCSASELVDQVVRDRRVLELAGGDGNGGRARDLWQRVRFVVDQARAWTDTTGGTLRRYLDWVRHQSAPGSRVAEAVLPETDDDAVRIMTVHAAKGLQFPITVLAGLSTYPQVRRAGAQVVWPPEGPCILNVGRRVTSPAYEVWRPLDEQMSHDERIRLLYVACTRARDHLVVSLHRRERAQPVTAPARMTNAELLVEALAPDLDHLPDATPPAPPPQAAPAPAPSPHAPHATPPGTAAGVPRPPGPAASGLPAFEEWARERVEALARSGRPRTVAATALTDEGRPDAEADPGLLKRPRDLDLPPWRKGRYGTAIGRAVHGVLQVVDLSTGAGVDEAVAAQAAAEGVVGHENRIRTLVEAALRAPTVIEAAARPHWREVHVAVPVDDDPSRTLEGYVDLLYRRDDGLVVVDYKTGPSGPGDDLDTLVVRYRLQGAAYALAVAEATGDETIADVVFVFLTPQGPVERSLPDLDAAIADARTQIRRGTFTVLG